MFKSLCISILMVNAINACACLKDAIKDAAIDDFKKKIKEEDEKQMKFIKGIVTDGNTVISHTNTLNSDEFLKADTLVLEDATDEDKKKLKDIFSKNLKKIKESAKYADNSVFYAFNIKIKENSYVFGLIEFDRTKLTNEFLQGVMNGTKKDVEVIELKDLEKNLVLKF